MLFRIGEVEIWRILESVTPLMPIVSFLPGLEAGFLAQHRSMIEPHGLRRDAESGEDWIVLPIQAFLLRTPRNLILVDACVGNDKTMPHRPFWHQMRSSRFMDALGAAGATPADVTHVMCTHLHVDHVGWTTTLRDGRWVPTFPNARVLVTEPELDHARALAEARPDGAPGRIWAETLGPLFDDGRFDLVASDHELDPAVRLRPTPGHTPGHVSVEIAAPGRHAPEAIAAGGAITGDMIHSPLQVMAPDLSPSVDHDPVLSARTRQAYLEEAADSGRLLLGTHFPLPSAGHVVRREGGFFWRPLLG